MGKKWKQWQAILGGSNITADGDCSHEIKRCLLLGRQVMTNLDSIYSEKAMAPHSSTLAWKIPWMEEPGGLVFMWSHRVGHNWSDLVAAAADSILNSRDITLPTKAHLVKAMVFSSSHVWMWELDYKESWAPKNWCFELWCWWRLLRVFRTARGSNQSILKEISPKYLLEGLMLKLKLQYFGHLIQRTDSLEKTLMLGQIEGGRSRGR